MVVNKYLERASERERERETERENRAAQPTYDIEYARRQADLLDDVSELEGSEHREFGGLHTHATARRQTIKLLPLVRERDHS